MVNSCKAGRGMGGVLRYLLLFDSMGSHFSSLACEYEGFPCSSVQSARKSYFEVLYSFVGGIVFVRVFWLRFSYKTIPLDGLYFLQWSAYFFYFFVVACLLGGCCLLSRMANHPY